MVNEFEKQIKRGMLDIIILNMLTQKPCHGYELLQEIKRSSQIFESLKEGTLYPRLYRLLDNECIEFNLAVDEKKSKVKKIYNITKKGKIQLEELLKIWDMFVEDMSSILGR